MGREHGFILILLTALSSKPRCTHTAPCVDTRYTVDRGLCHGPMTERSSDHQHYTGSYKHLTLRCSQRVSTKSQTLSRRKVVRIRLSNSDKVYTHTPLTVVDQPDHQHLTALGTHIKHGTMNSPSI